MDAVKIKLWLEDGRIEYTPTMDRYSAELFCHYALASGYKYKKSLVIRAKIVTVLN